MTNDERLRDLMKNLYRKIGSIACDAKEFRRIGWDSEAEHLSVCNVIIRNILEENDYDPLSGEEEA